MWRFVLTITILLVTALAEAENRAATQFQIVSASLSPVIRSYRPAGCLQPGNTITLTGKNFGKRPALALVLQRGRSSMTLRSLRWSAQAIQIQLPSRLPDQNPDGWQLGFQQRGNWVGQPLSRLSICQPEAKSAPRAETTEKNSPSESASSSSASAPAAQPQAEENTQQPAPEPEPHTNTSGTTDPAIPETDTTAPDTTQTDTAAHKTPSKNPAEPPPRVTRPTESQPEEQNTTPRAEPDSPLPESPPVSSELSLLDMPLPAASRQPPASDREQEPDQLVVATDSMKQAQRISAFMRNQGARIKSRQRLQSLDLVMTVFRLPPNSNQQLFIDRLRQEFPEAVADKNHHYHLLSGDSSLADAKAWSLNAIGWSNTSAECEASTAIGILDTLASTTHPALNSADITVKNFTGREPPASADHGTAIAVLLAGKLPSQFASLLTDPQIKVAGVFRQTQDKQSTTLEYLLYGLDWLIREKVRVINLSLGGPHNRLLAHALHKAFLQNIILVAAAGNSGSQSPPVYPAALPEVIAVTAIDAAGNLYRHASLGNYIDITAPGVDIWVANAQGDGSFRSGTSYAAVFVTAFTAAFGKPDSWASASRDIGKPGKDHHFGWGLLNWRQCP